jgi:hypothetical protein
VIELNFDGVKDPKERDCFLGLPTTFALPRHQVTALIEVAGELLDAHPEFGRLLGALNIRPQTVQSPPRSSRCAPDS